MTDTPDAVRIEFERYFLESRKSKGTNRKPTFERFEDGTYKDDHTQRHWWTWQNALLCRIPAIETARDVAVELAAQYAAERDQLRAELDARWLPIETAPKNGTVVILGLAGDGEDVSSVSTTGHWQEAEEDGVDYMGADAGFVDEHYQEFKPGRSFGNPKYMYAPRQPTHYMPLPAAPTPPHADQKGQ